MPSDETNSASPAVVSIVGKSDSGKTTLVEKLIPKLEEIRRQSEESTPEPAELASAEEGRRAKSGELGAQSAERRA